MKLTIIDASWHRNGIGGEGFYAVLFNDAEQGENNPMIASLFDAPGYCAVYSVPLLSKGNIKFARGNSWRGDQYASELQPLVEEFLKKKVLTASVLLPCKDSESIEKEGLQLALLILKLNPGN